MANTRYSNRYGYYRPYKRRNNEIEGDLQVYLREAAEGNDEALRRLKRNLSMARQEELTARQSQLLQLYFDRRLTMREIGRQLGINTSTVSRTIRRAERRLERCLRYGL